MEYAHPKALKKVDHHSHNAYNEHLSLYLRYERWASQEQRATVYTCDDIVGKKKGFEVSQLNAPRLWRTGSIYIYGNDHRISLLPFVNLSLSPALVSFSPATPFSPPPSTIEWRNCDPSFCFFLNGETFDVLILDTVRAVIDHDE